MLCKHPYRKGGLEFGCGQCIPCRINRSRQWVGRMLLESYEHPFSAFITLTYSEEHVPFGECVSKRHVQLFIKSLRLTVAPRKIRYYMVSEYGEENRRPHYHGILYGISPMEQDLIQKVWPHGFVMVGTAQHQSMSYVSGYIIKQKTHEGTLLRGTRTVEFSLMSRKPGLGAGVVERIKNAYQTPAGKAALQRDAILSSGIRTDGHKYPLGRYLRGKCVDSLGLSPIETSNRFLSMVDRKRAENRGFTRKEVRVRRQAAVDQQAFRTNPKRRTL